MAISVPTGAVLARIALGAFFIWSGGIKLNDLEGFAEIAEAYRLPPAPVKPLVRPVAYVLPFTELVAGTMIVAWFLPLAALVYVGVSLLGYSALIVWELAQGDSSMQNCGCYGTAIVAPLSWRQVAKNVVLLGITASLLATLL